MYAALIALHIVVCAVLMVVVLLQSGKGGGLAGAFGGGGGAGAVFGGQTAATFLVKATRYLAISFMVTSLALAVFSRGRYVGAVEQGLEGQEAVPATAAGDVVPLDGVPEGVPGDLPGGEETPTGGEEIPVAAPDGGD